MLDLFLLMSLGFLGSFGHCLGMCGPITVAFSLTHSPDQQDYWSQLRFHSLLNLGRLLSYTLVGAGIGAVGSVLIAGGQMAGISSLSRQILAILTGSLLIWFGIRQIKPSFLPQLTLFVPFAGAELHRPVNRVMSRLSKQLAWWTPILLGGMWGFIPCGFLYAAQLKAAETGSLWMGAASMAAFGLGTLPTMLAIGLTTAKMSAERRSQLFRLGGWLTLSIGVLTLFRTDAMVDSTGQGALLLLIFALVARPISHFWPQPLQYRRAIGMGAFSLALAHTGHMLSYTLQWRLEAIAFMLPQFQAAMHMGILSFILMIPAAITSFDRVQYSLGHWWRRIHLLLVPAFILAVGHVVLLGSKYLSGLDRSWPYPVRTSILCGIALMVLLSRTQWTWTLLSLNRFYRPPIKEK